MTRLRYLIVGALEYACCAIDKVTPGWRWNFPGRVCRLAEWSSNLDDRWNTGWWQPVEDEA